MNDEKKKTSAKEALFEVLLHWYYGSDLWQRKNSEEVIFNQYKNRIDNWIDRYPDFSDSVIALVNCWHDSYERNEPAFLSDIFDVILLDATQKKWSKLL